MFIVNDLILIFQSQKKEQSMFYGDLLEKRRTEAEKEQEKFVAQIIYIFISSPILLLSVFFRLLLNFFKISSKFMRFFLAYLANLSEE